MPWWRNEQGLRRHVRKHSCTNMASCAIVIALATTALVKSIVTTCMRKRTCIKNESKKSALINITYVGTETGIFHEK